MSADSMRPERLKEAKKQVNVMMTQLLENVAPKDTNRHETTILADNIRKTLEQSKSLGQSELAKGRFLQTGSVSRKTDVYPRGDVDVVWELTERGKPDAVPPFDADEILDTLKKALDEKFLGCTKKKRHCITVSKPAQTRITCDITPAVVAGDNGHWVPKTDRRCPGQGMWENKGFNAAKEDAVSKRREEGHARTTEQIRLVKKWNKNKEKLFKKQPFESFFLELLVYKVMDDQATEETGPLKLLEATIHEMRNSIDREILEPGTDNMYRIEDKLLPNGTMMNLRKARRLLRGFHRSIKKAMLNNENGHPKRVWQALRAHFGDAAPRRPNS